MLLLAAFAGDVTDHAVAHGSTCDPSLASICDAGLACVCKSATVVSSAKHALPAYTLPSKETNGESSEPAPAPYLESTFPDLGQGFPGLTPAGKAYYAGEFRDLIRSRMSATGRRLDEEAGTRDCLCLPAKASLDLSDAPVFQANYPKGFGTANPVNRDTAGAVSNPNWENCGHCALPARTLELSFTSALLL